jgi:acetyltransferase-like isoleucine patch superfamily enzyme
VRSDLKSWLAAALGPAARLHRAAEPLRRAWRHARLAMALGHRVDPSIVLLGSPYVDGTAAVRLGRELYVYPDLHLETQDVGQIVIGDRVVLSRGVHLVSFARIEIGEGSLIGEYASVRDANHRFGRDLVLRDGPHDAAPIRIGRNVWIGRGVSVLAGVHIGDGAVIGANAVVTHDVAAGAVAVGIPARARPRAAA